VRQTGSHMRLTSELKGRPHHITIPNRNPIKIGTLNNILNDVAQYLGVDKSRLIRELFG
ncbi:MAG: type II toxin-antitoxin system HicA family toxin, partial [Clostridia bacterium]|nr:type II toxin-antitoxin system HicA family toxin [Clostridia bacterium]